MKRHILKLFSTSLTIVIVLTPLFGITWTEHTIDGNFDGARFVHAADVDGDGDMDVLGAAHSQGITWWENDGSGSFTKHKIDSTFYGAQSVYAADVDGDGDMDVLGAADGVNDITWWENDGNENFTEHTIDDNCDGSSVYAADVDGDGDMDVLGASFQDNDIYWYENDGNESFTKYTIDSHFPGAQSVYAADLDGDGDMDVLGAAAYDHSIEWWENDGSQSFTQHDINESTFQWARSVHAADVDGDGDMDVLGAGQGSGANTNGKITWWENDGSGSFTEHTIDGNFDGAYSVHAADVDGDGDMDVLGAADDDHDITWWENDGNENFTEHTIDGFFQEASSVYAADLDGDGDMDVLGAANYVNDIHWWESDVHNDSPADFSLTEPSNNAEIMIDASNVDNGSITFSWGESSDANDDLLLYLMSATSNEIGNHDVDTIATSFSVAYADIIEDMTENNVTVATIAWTVHVTDGIDTVEADNAPFTVTIDGGYAMSTFSEALIPEVFALHQNYPNPFNPITTLRYDLPEQAIVNIIIYDMLGREVKTLVNSTQDAGFKSVIWDATNDYGKPVSAGVYLYQIQAGEFRQTKKMVLLK